jgi:hypothetical protein
MTGERMFGAMKSRVFYISVMLLLVTTGLMTSFLIGCGNKTGSIPATSTASLSDAAICKSFNQSTGPSDTTSSFARNDPWVICAVKVSDAPSNTKVKAAFFYEGSERHSETLYVQGTKWLGYTLKPDNLNVTRFQTGSYSVKLYLNGEEKTNLAFKVE